MVNRYWVPILYGKKQVNFNIFSHARSNYSTVERKQTKRKRKRQRNLAISDLHKIYSHEGLASRNETLPTTKLTFL